MSLFMTSVFSQGIVNCVGGYWKITKIFLYFFSSYFSYEYIFSEKCPTKTLRPFWKKSKKLKNFPKSDTALLEKSKKNVPEVLNVHMNESEKKIFFF